MRDYVEANCFPSTKPLVVPARTFLATGVTAPLLQLASVTKSFGAVRVEVSCCSLREAAA